LHGTEHNVSVCSGSYRLSTVAGEWIISSDRQHSWSFSIPLNDRVLHVKVGAAFYGTRHAARDAETFI
jgi:hypothetical protein